MKEESKNITMKIITQELAPLLKRLQNMEQNVGEIYNSVSGQMKLALDEANEITESRTCI